MSSYIELGASTGFSFLQSTGTPEALVQKAAALNYPALAITDYGGLYAIPRAAREAQKQGLKLIIGSIIHLQDLGWIRLIATSKTGYANLSRLITLGRFRGGKAKCLVLSQELREFSPGLIALMGPGLHCSSLNFQTLIDIFSRENLYLEINYHLERNEIEKVKQGLRYAQELSLQTVATNNVRHLLKNDKPLLDIVTCIKHHTTLDQAGTLLYPNRERYLKSPLEISKVFERLPNLLHTSYRISERIEFEFETLPYEFPKFNTPKDLESNQYLRTLVYEGAAIRYKKQTKKIKYQLDKELGIIQKLKLSGYFLIVWDIIRYAKSHNILVQGRGSAANSAVCYCLEITAIDPIGMDLLFERFLSEERGEWPDIDLDLPSGAKREAVIQYMYKKYGPHGIAMTANVITYRNKSAIREVGKCLGINTQQIDKATKICGQWSSLTSISELLESFSNSGLNLQDKRLKLWCNLAESLQNTPRHLGQHSGGMVLASGRLDTLCPIEPATMKNRFVVQWDKEDCADLGFIKVDLLGLGMLNALEKAIPLLEQTENIKLDYAHIPKNDPRVYRQLQKADTVGVFQLESRAQMSMLPRLKPKNFYDLVVEIALIRPGPIVGKMVHPYLKRRSAAEAIRYPHPKLEPILKRTLGIPIFQEQLLKIAMAIADFSGGEAEELRRAMGFKRSETRMSDIISKLKSGMTRNNIPVETQNELIQYIQSFALYGFPESHSASFALIAYASAYLKVYYPGVFLCALLNAWPLGFYSPATLVKDAQRHNVKVFPIDISRSSWECTMPQKNTVRLGLRFLNQLRRSTGQSILSARSEAPFKNLNDLCIRTTVNKTERLSLAESGALECFGHSRRNSLWQINRFHPSNHDLFSNLSKPLSNSPLKEMDTLENILADYQHVGLSIKSHPMALFRPHLSSSMVTSLKLAQCPNHSLIETAGIVTVRQRPSNAKGFFFITLEDEFGFINLVLEPNFFKKNRVLATQCAALKVLGNIQQAEGVTHIRCKSLTPIHLQERRK